MSLRLAAVAKFPLPPPVWSWATSRIFLCIIKKKNRTVDVAKHVFKVTLGAQGVNNQNVLRFRLKVSVLRSLLTLGFLWSLTAFNPLPWLIKTL